MRWLLVKTVAIIGSTGSIGTQALDVLQSLQGEYEVIALAANKNIELLSKQIQLFQPRFATLKDKESREELKKIIDDGKTKIIDTESCLEETINRANADITLISVVGSAGLLPSLTAAKLGKRLALANKESLVIGGDLLINTCKKYNTELIPVDSEHSAIFQCLLGQDTDQVEKIILTASGGPFFKVDKEIMDNASVKEALNHPNWDMGGKITIDSATMMNKGLEVIEAHYLFDLSYDKIDVLIHPQSIVHSLVEYSDGSLIAQLGLADMRVPIQFAFSYPQRQKRAQSFSLIDKKLEFFEPDLEKFGCLKLAYEAGKAGNDRPVVLNAANEVAVEYFLSKKISFGSIYRIVKETLEVFPHYKTENLEEKLFVDQKVRAFVEQELSSRRWR